MSLILPTLGQTGWGKILNDALLFLQSLIFSKADKTHTHHTSEINTLNEILLNKANITELEAKADIEDLNKKANIIHDHKLVDIKGIQNLLLDMTNIKAENIIVSFGGTDSLSPIITINLNLNINDTIPIINWKIGYSFYSTSLPPSTNPGSGSQNSINPSFNSSLGAVLDENPTVAHTVTIPTHMAQISSNSASFTIPKLPPNHGLWGNNRKVLLAVTIQAINPLNNTKTPDLFVNAITIHCMVNQTPDFDDTIITRGEFDLFVNDFNTFTTGTTNSINQIQNSINNVTVSRIVNELVNNPNLLQDLTNRLQHSRALGQNIAEFARILN